MRSAEVTSDAAVALGFCLVAIRSITGIGFDSSTRGGSLTGKNTSRTLLHKEASVPSSCNIMPPSLSEDSTPARKTGAGLNRSSVGTIPNSDKLDRLNRRVQMHPLCLPSKISPYAVSRYVPGLVPVHCVQRCIWPHMTFYKRFARRMSRVRLMFSQLFDADTPPEVSPGRTAALIPPSPRSHIQ